jgi:glycosyltransferase involved in cell wall biosynthesis
MVAPLRLASVFRQNRFDVVHSHNWGGLVDTVVAAKLARVGVVVHTQHGLDYGFATAPDHLRSRFRTRLKRLACRGVARIATVSHEVADVVTHEWRVPSARVSVVHNGVQMPSIDEGLRARRREELGASDSDVLLGTVAVFRPVKDLHTMLEAMALVVEQTSCARLVLIGDGRLRQELEATVERLGLTPFVRFTGWRTDASELLQALDVFVLSSVSEGISLALLDAMAAGVPAVVTSVGGNCEVIEEPRDGVLVPPREPQALAQALLALVGAPDRRRALGASGRRRVEKTFSFARMISDYRALYTNAQAQG